MERRLHWKRSRTWLALLSAILLATGGPGVRALHGLFVPHRLCEVHGELEHVPAGAGAPHTELAREPGSDGGGPALASLAAEAPHSSCSLGCVARTEPFLALSPAPEAGTTEGTPPSWVVVPETCFPPIALLALAPKHSPPS